MFVKELAVTFVTKHAIQRDSHAQNQRFDAARYWYGAEKPQTTNMAAS